MAHDRNSAYIQSEIDKRVSAWYLFLNEIFGVLGFGLALGAIGTDSPRFYGGIVFAFLATLYIPEAIKRREFLKLLRQVKHPSLSLLNSARAGAVYWFGFAFLVLVVAGVLNKTSNINSVLQLLT